MKLAVSSYSLSRWRAADGATLEDTIDFIADLGVPGIEFSGLDEKAKDDPIGRATELRARAEKKGMTVRSYCVGADLLCPEAQQKKVVAQVKQEVDVAAALGASSMRHDVARGFEGWKTYKGPKSVAAAIKIVKPAIIEITEYAQERGVKTSLENHGFFFQGSGPVTKLIDAVGHPNFGLTIDMGNFLCVDQDPVEAVEEAASYAIMAHVKDFHVRPKKSMPPSGWFATPKSIALRGAIVGHGVIDIPKQLKLLKKAKYNDFLSLEFEGMEDPRTGVKLGIEYLTRELEAIKALDR